MSAQEAENQVTPQLPHERFRLDRTLMILIVLGVLGAILFAWKDNEAFPEASLDLKLSKGEILSLALDWARKLNYRKDNLITCTSFSFDTQAKNYLELELGQKRANELMKSEMPMWWWRTRLCKEFDQEQFYSYISPTGKLICLSYSMQNDKALPSITQDQAKEMARQFIEKEAGISLADYTLITNSTNKLPHRQDHDFNWEDRKHPYGDAYLRVSATISGNQVSNFYHYLHVPEAWERKFNTIRSYNELLGRIAFVFNSLLYLAAAFILIWAVTSRNARWRVGAIFGLLVFLGCMAMIANDWTSIIESYPTQSQFRTYLVTTGVRMLGSCFAFGLSAALYVMAGEAMYRNGNPERVAFENYFKLRPFSTIELSKGLIVGISLFCIALGWVVLYYLIGGHFGFWCPLDLSDYQVLSAAAPAYTAVCIGVEAAVNEEFLYRVIGLGLAKKMVKKFWLANLMQAAAWGFAHSTYPQEPPYARGVELTCSGLVFGWIMNKYGLLPCLVAHYLLDAFLTAQPLLGSGKLALVASAVAPVLPAPLLAIFAIARARRAPEDESALKNECLTPPKKETADVVEEPHRKFEYVPISARARLILLAAAAVAIVTGVVFTKLEQDRRIFSDNKIFITRAQAIHKAWDVLASHGVALKPTGSPASAWQVSATLSDDIQREQMQYLFEKTNWARTLELARATQRGYYWRVRFFKPMQAEEYEVDLDNRGAEIEFDTTLQEDQPGPQLSEPDARKIAEKYLDQIHPQYKPFVYESTTKTDRRHRLDYRFTYKIPAQKAPSAESKIDINVKGDKISEMSRYWELPDQWKWEREKHTWKDDALAALRVFAVVVLLVLMLWWAIGLLRTGYFPFRPALIFGAAMTFLYLPDALNGLVDVLMTYSTTTPMSSFVINQVVRILETAASKLGQYALIMLLALPCARILAPTANPVALLCATLKPAADEISTHRNLWIDAIVVAYSCVALSWGLNCLLYWLHLAISPAVPVAQLGAIDDMANVFFPSLNIVTDSIAAGMSMLLMVPILVGLYSKYLRRFWAFMLFTVLGACIAYSGEKYWQDFALDVITTSIVFPSGWLLVAKFARRNMLAYVMLGMVSSICGKLPAIWQHGVPLFSAEAIASCILLLLPLLYVLYIGFKKEPIEMGEDTGQPA